MQECRVSPRLLHAPARIGRFRPDGSMWWRGEAVGASAGTSGRCGEWRIAGPGSPRGCRTFLAGRGSAAARTWTAPGRCAGRWERQARTGPSFPGGEGNAALPGAPISHPDGPGGARAARSGNSPVDWLGMRSVRRSQAAGTTDRQVGHGRARTLARRGGRRCPLRQRSAPPVPGIDDGLVDRPSNRPAKAGRGVMRMAACQTQNAGRASVERPSLPDGLVGSAMTAPSFPAARIAVRRRPRRHVRASGNSGRSKAGSSRCRMAPRPGAGRAGCVAT